MLLVVREAVGVEPFAYRRVAGLPHLVLVKDPFQGRAATQAVLPRFGRNAGQRRLFIQSDDAVLLVGSQDDPRRRYPVLVETLQ